MELCTQTNSIIISILITIHVTTNAHCAILPVDSINSTSEIVPDLNSTYVSITKTAPDIMDNSTQELNSTNLSTKDNSNEKDSNQTFVQSSINSIKSFLRFRRAAATTSKKPKKYDYKRDPPPYKWTFDPTRRHVDLFSPNASLDFPFKICFFDTEEAIENYYREIAKPTRNFSNYKGPQLEYWPNGTLKKIVRKYSFMGNDNISEEAKFHRRCMQQIEEFYLQNVSVLPDYPEKRTDSLEKRYFPTKTFTRRCKLRMRSKYKGWTYGTPIPGTSYSPGVEINLPHSDLFYEDQLGYGGPGNETFEEYYHNTNISPVDYNDSIFDLPSDPDSEILKRPKYKKIADLTPPGFYDAFNTDKSHYHDGLSGDAEGVIR